MVRGTEAGEVTHVTSHDHPTTGLHDNSHDMRANDHGTASVSRSQHTTDNPRSARSVSRHSSDALSPAKHASTN
jgi:hypothetical protein